MPPSKIKNAVTRPWIPVVNAEGNAKPASSIRMSQADWRRLDAAGIRFGGLSRGETVEVMLDLVEKQP